MTRQTVIDYILPRIQNKRVLDVGCVGRWPDDDLWFHDELVSNASECVGIDLDAEKIERISEHGYDVYVADAESFDLNQEFDVIVAGEVIEHMVAPGEFFDSCKSHLREGGELILSTPYPFALVQIARKLIPGMNVSVINDHTMWFCPDTIETLAERKGWTVDEIKFARASTNGVTQFLYDIGYESFEDDFMARLSPEKTPTQ
ncbi:class I SAM-dependent methyltransferase [Halobaculum roseum]|uniref:Class I SAM-dependent methyltransferase n=1 Tax=Halobaculum roseum TaxID=2175149 RepID=A0ABD5MIZ1_9EURY|nr:class I SAM-dependent methyltransferase [Halobaculum roseum]QZY02527.1 class I SAM-dependent methyltransferase [Halobaculum roseum]